MSVSFNATVVVGFRVSDVIKKTIVKTVVKKFDPDTGEPKNIIRRKVKNTLWGVSVGSNPDEWSYASRKPLGILEMFSCGGEDMIINDYVIGLAVTTKPEQDESEDYDSGVFELAPEAIESARSAVVKEATARGCEIAPKLYLVSSVSY